MDEANQASTSEYKGSMGQTRQESLHYTCEKCGYLFGAEVYRSINVASDPSVGELLEQGELNTLTCPACDSANSPNIPLLYHNPDARCFALLLPEVQRHLELEEKARVLTELAGDTADIPHYVKQVDVVFGTGGLVKLLDRNQEVLTADWEKEKDFLEQRELLDQRQRDLEQREAALIGREEDVQAKQEDLISRRTKLERDKDELTHGWADLAREREALQALSVDLEAQEREMRERARTRIYDERSRELPMPEAQEEVDEQQATTLASPLALDGRPQEEVDRWRASDESAMYLLHDETVYLLAKPVGELYDRLLAGEPSAMIQLFGFTGGPMVSLVVTPGDTEPDDCNPDEAVCWYLDPGSLTGRDILNCLAQDFSLHLDIYDQESRPVATWQIEAPLAENVADILRRADVQLEAMEQLHRDFTAAVEDYLAMGEDRLGRKQHNFSPDSFQTLPSPAAARLALGIVSYWSEPDNQDYLLLVKSFPVRHWRDIRHRVVKRALDFGLALSPPLTDFALEEKMAATREDLLHAAVASFAEVSLRLKPSDLDPAQEWENWKLLLADCAVEGVQVDPKIEELAAAAARRVEPVVDESSAGGDLSLLAEDELLPLLTERDMRRDAALELCERGQPSFLAPVYNAVCNMTRAEVARVLPALIQFGDEAVPLLIKGLRHRKSFIRQGSALALGSMKSEEDALEPLIDMLLSEPTNVWREAARALGDMGPLAIGALIAGVKGADGEGRERIAWGLAQVAITDEGNAEVEAMSKGKNTRLARVASRAIELFTQVVQHDDEVRGIKPLTESTIVRSFSRRFYESMQGEVSVLNEDDILEESLDVEDHTEAEIELGEMAGEEDDQAEELDESDILEEEVAVDEEDIVDAAPGADEDDNTY